MWSSAQWTSQQHLIRDTETPRVPPRNLRPKSHTHFPGLEMWSRVRSPSHILLSSTPPSLYRRSLFHYRFQSAMATAIVAEVDKTAHPFDKANLEALLSRRFFYAPAFEIYGGTNAFAIPPDYPGRVLTTQFTTIAPTRCCRLIRLWSSGFSSPGQHNYRMAQTLHHSGSHARS